MVSECLNSHCSATLKYLGRGRLFRVDFTDADKKNAMNAKKVVVSIRSKANPIEHFWLCESCATTMTVELNDAGEVRLVPLVVSARRPRAVPSPQTHTQQEESAS